jgi:hypothetical protein
MQRRASFTAFRTDDERHGSRPEVAASLQVAAAAGRLRRCGSEVLSAAKDALHCITSSPRLASAPLARATQPAWISAQTLA